MKRAASRLHPPKLPNISQSTPLLNSLGLPARPLALTSNHWTCPFFLAGHPWLSRLGVSVRSDWTGLVVQLDDAICPASAASTQVTRRKPHFHRRFVPRDRYTWMERALGGSAQSVSRESWGRLFGRPSPGPSRPFRSRRANDTDRTQLVDGELSRSARVNPQLTEAWQTVETRLNRNELSAPKGNIPGMFHISASRSASSTERCLRAWQPVEELLSRARQECLAHHSLEKSGIRWGRHSCLPEFFDRLRRLATRPPSAPPRTQRPGAITAPRSCFLQFDVLADKPGRWRPMISCERSRSNCGPEQSCVPFSNVRWRARQRTVLGRRAGRAEWACALSAVPGSKVAGGATRRAGPGSGPSAGPPRRRVPLLSGRRSAVLLRTSLDSGTKPVS
jgi:hypothetical protein